MKKGICSVILLALLATSHQQVKPFIDPISILFGVGSGWMAGLGAGDIIRGQLIKAAAAALIYKAQEGAQVAEQFNNKILELKKEIQPFSAVLRPKETATLKMQIAVLEKERDKNIGMAHRIAGVLAPTLGLLSNVSTAYGAVSGIASYFGYGVPVLPGSSSLFNYLKP
jgi:hypothetical protein